MRSEEAVEKHQLRVELGQAVTEVLGVARVEPTLRSALAAVTAGAGQALVGRASPGAVHALGIDLDTRVELDPVLDPVLDPGLDPVAAAPPRIWTDVTVDIATWPSRPAVEIARAVRAAIRAALTARGLTPGRVVINVMDIGEGSGG